MTITVVGKPLTISAEVRDSSAVKWVHLRFRSVNQQLDFKTLAMSPATDTNTYQATIPADEIISKWDLMYFFEVMDQHGNGKIYPDLNTETPYVVVRVR